MRYSVTKSIISVFLLSCISLSAEAKDPPVITEIDPPAGLIETEVKINGKNFSGEALDNRVRLGVVKLKTTSVHPNQIRVVIPKKAKTGKISVEVKNAGKAVSKNDFVVMKPLNVSSISDSYGAPGSTITIKGAGFSTKATDNTVTLDGVKCKVLRASANELKIKLPNQTMSGKFSISVKYSGKIENRNNFLVAYQPVIRTFKPSSGTPGTEVTILGDHFGSDTSKVQVRLGGKPSRVVSVNNKKIVIQVPKGAPTGAIQLAVNKLRSAPTTKSFEVREGLVATKMDPLKVFRGQEVRVYGRGFNPKTALNKLIIGKISVKASRMEAGAVVFTVPDRAPLGKNKVVLDAKTQGKFDIPVPLTILEPTTVTGFSPATSPVGGVVSISGRNFGNSSNNVRVIIGGKYAYVRNVSPSSIMVNVPKDATSSPITVQTRYYGTAVSKQTLTVIPPVLINSFSPTYGAPNQQVRLYGEGFSAQKNKNKVTIGRAQAKVLEASTNSLLVQIPSNATTDKFRVTVGGSGYGESTAPFTVRAPAPPPPAAAASVPMTITSISPDTGKVGSYVTVNGTGFTPQGIRAYVGRVPAGVRVYTTTRAMIAIPNNATGGPVTFVSPTGAQARSKQIFKMVTPVSINKFYPNRGRPGDKVTIYGSDFKPGATRVYLGKQQLRVDPGMNATMMTVTIPNGAASGPFRVAVAGKPEAKSVSVYKVLPPVVAVPKPAAKPKEEPIFTSTKDDTPVIETLMKEEPKKEPEKEKKAPTIDELLGFESAEGEKLQITSIDPKQGPVGETVTINGSGFGDNAGKVSAWIGTKKAQVVGAVPDMIMIEVPAGATSGKVKLKIAGKPSLTSKEDFKVVK